MSSFFHKFPKSYGRKRAIVDSSNLIKFMAALMLPSAKKRERHKKRVFRIGILLPKLF